MHVITSIGLKAIILSKKLRYIFYTPQKYSYSIKNVPYFSQFASQDLVEAFVQGEKEILDDPKWKQSGAKTKEEYAIWANNGCGMACLQMILAKQTGKTLPLVHLGKKCLEYGGYRLNKQTSNYRNYYNGMFYQPFVTFIQKEFALTGKIVAPMILKEILQAIDTDNYVIASVDPLIRKPHEKAKTKQDHLILIIGYDKQNQLLYFHNPSGIYKQSQEYVAISFSNFSKFFAQRGIVIKR